MLQPHLLPTLLIATLLGAQDKDAARPKVPPFDGGLVCVLQVKDLDAALGWYTKTLGMRPLWKSDEIGFAEVATAVGDVRLGLARHEQPSVAPGVVLTFGVTDIAAAKAALEQAKCKLGEYNEYPDLVKLQIFQDLDGNVLQLYESLQKPPPQHAGLEAVAFLAGSWVRETKDDRQEEHWTAPAGGAMVGMARTVKKGKAVFFEHLRIEAGKDGVVYWAAPGGKPAVPFALKTAEKHKVVFENEKHDFPKRIVYWLERDGSLRARIEGDGGKAQDFAWQRGALR
jgi:catechol 2,3-dioxygenase-like lactoylglutathione lyase family enzyme